MPRMMNLTDASTTAISPKPWTKAAASVTTRRISAPITGPRMEAIPPITSAVHVTKVTSEVNSDGVTVRMNYT